MDGLAIRKSTASSEHTKSLRKAYRHPKVPPQPPPTPLALYRPCFPYHFVSVTRGENPAGGVAANPSSLRDLAAASG